MTKKGFWANVLACIVPIVLYFSLTNCFTVKILNKLSYDHFDGVVSEMPNYTDYIDPYNYLSGNIVFDPVALAGYYHLTENFMNSVLDPNFISEDMIEWEQQGSKQSPKLSVEFVKELLKKNWVFVLIIVITLLIAVIIPIVGIIFCCCRCCGNCGYRSRPSDKKKDHTKKCVYGVLLISCGTILLMTVVCLFATNKQMYEGISEFPDSIRESYGDGTAFLDSVMGQARELLLNNYDQFAEVFNNTLGNSGQNILQKVDSWSNATAIITLDNFVNRISDINGNMKKLNDSVYEIKGNVKELQNGFNLTKNSLTSILTSCSADVQECANLLTSISKINLNIDADKFPDLKTTLDELKALKVGNLIEAANAGNYTLGNLTIKINETIGKNTNAAYEAIATAKITIEDNFNNATEIISDLQLQLKNVNSTMEDSYHYIKYYSSYFYYGGLVISCVLLLIVACVTFGLVFGIFGTRPEKYNRTFLSKGTGSTFLTSSVLLISVFTFLMGILTFVMLVAGLLVERGICYPLRNPEHSTVITIINKLVPDNSTSDLNLNISQILVRCRDNESLYQVFNLSDKIDVDTLGDKFNISTEVDEIFKNINAKIENILPKNFSILNESQLKELKELKNLNLVVPFDIYQKQLNPDIFNTYRTDLQSVIDKLGNILRNYSSIWTDAQRTQLKDSISTLEEQSKTVQGIMTTANETLDLAKSLNTDLMLNSTSFSDGINELLGNITIANEKLKNESSQLIEGAKKFGQFVQELAEGYLNRVVNVTKNDLGRCGHLSVAIDSLLIATCDNIFLPWNGFWVALFISLLVFIPTWIVSIVLSSLYKKYRITGEVNRSPAKSKRDNKKNKRDRTKNYQPGSFYDGTATDGTASDWLLLQPEGSTFSRTLIGYERPPPYYPGFFEL